MGGYKRKAKLQYTKHRRRSEIDSLISRAHGPLVRDFRDSPSATTEAKIQATIAKKGKLRYDKKFGLTVPSLTVEEAMEFMPPSKRSIMESYRSGKFAFVTRKELEKGIEKAISWIETKIKECEDKIKEKERDLSENKTLEDLQKRGWTYSSYEEFVKLSKDTIEHERQEIKQLQEVLALQKKDRKAVLDFVLTPDGPKITKRKTTLEDALKEGYVIEDPSELKKPIMGKYVWVQKPTLSGGVGLYVGPYHLRDSKTGEEVRLWEWGVDYDVG